MEDIYPNVPVDVDQQSTLKSFQKNPVEGSESDFHENSLMINKTTATNADTETPLQKSNDS